MTTDTKRNWTPPQQAAIEHVAGDLLVSAAAGSGKTAVLAERCARLVCENVDGGCGVEGLLVLTFTEAAANEMRSRISNAIREKITSGKIRTGEQHHWLQRQAAMVERASISTLHSFCARTLRQHFHEARIDPAFELIDEDEARLLRDETLEEVLARWHKLPAGPQADAFATFFEAYAQGRDSGCRDMILRVYHMLASTADPADYIARSRALYAHATCADTVQTYVQTVIAGELRLLTLSAARALAEARRKTGPDSAFTAGISKATDMLAWAQRHLSENGPAAIPLLRDSLLYKWPQCKTLADVPDFDSLKKRAWEKTRDNIKAFCNSALAITPADLHRDLATLAPPLGTLLALVDDFTRTFTATKRAQNRLDFNDLERLTLNLLTATADTPSLAAAELRTRYHHLLVDEFQDINPLQEALLAAVRSPDRFDGRGNLFVVGDVKQSIYGFRLANPDLFLGREKTARAATTPDARRYVALPHNFRSHAKLLHTMNGLFEKLLTPEIAGITYADGHALEPSPTPPPVTDTNSLHPFDGNPLELHLVIMQKDEDDDDAESDATANGAAPALPAENLSALEEEARMVADRIAALMRDSRGILQKDGSLRPLAFRDIAILLRSVKSKAMIFARALATRGIPVHADLATGYFDTPEVRDTLALLHILDNPRQDIPLATVLLGPYARFSHDDLATIRLTYDRKSVTFADAVHRYPDDAPAMRPGLPDAGRDIPPFNPDLADRLHALFKKLADWRARLRTRPLHEGLADIYSDSKILPYLAGLDAGTQRVANLQALHGRALRFAGFNKQGLHRFLRFIEKLRDNDGDFGEAPVLSEASDVVRIMSVHKSKGLEFPVVFVSGLGSMLNLNEGGPVTLHRDIGVGLQVADVDRNIFYPSAASATIVHSAQRHGRAEELRLLYVALTRARDHLILTGHLNKSDTLDAARAEWSAHAGPLPEDKLLKGRTFLDWLLPAIACSPLRIQWPADNSCNAPQLTITTRAPSPSPSASTAAESASPSFESLLAPDPAAPVTPAVEQLLTRITAIYPHDAKAHEPAVRTVSELKSLALQEPDSPAAPLLVAPTAPATLTSKDDPLLRGLATHRLLQLLDFTRCDSPDAVAALRDELLAAKKITPDEAALADLPGIAWFLTTESAARLIAAAKRRAAGDRTIHLRRELPFTWAAPLSPAIVEPSADHPTIRGTIDLLLVDAAAKTAELFDYKTDSPFTWQNRVPEYRQQMQYYLRAATDILRFPVSRATLLFLSARQVVEVPLSAD